MADVVEPVSAPPKRKLENRHQRPEPETRPARAEMPEIADQLADDAVSGEPVCGANSLLTGKITGNFTKIGLLRENLPVRTQQNQLLRG